MKSLSIGTRLIFDPNNIVSKKEGKPNLESLSIGILLGVIGFILQWIFIFPADEISFGFDNQLLESFLNKTAGAILGFLLIFVLMIFEKLILWIFGFRKFKHIHRGSMANFFLMPFITIPIHSLFDDQLSLRGYWWILLVLIVVFVIWHIMLLENLLLRFFKIMDSEVSYSKEQIKHRILILLIVELICAFTFLLLIPLAFDVTILRGMGEYF
ncbi:MAG: hypothetical protein GF364_11355 [Candidatus Lokiarchaeota archaeon]|nr:hypothetical protein [Candidatus Lokiarchaeota archaeon]